MSNKTLRNIAAIAAHDALAAARNPTMLVMLAACIFLTLVFSSIASSGAADQFMESQAYLMTTVIAIAPAFTGSIVSLYAMAEEIERGVPVTLTQAGVTTGQIAAGKLIASFAWTLVTAVLACAVLGYSAGQMALTIALAIPSSLPVLLVSLGCGLLAYDQMKSSIYSVPIVVIAIIPLLGLISTSLRAVARFLPMGFAAEAACLATSSPAMLSPAAIVALGLAWIAACAAFALWAGKRYRTRIAALCQRQG